MSDGKYIGPYRLLDRLGQGGMGKVFLAVHKLLDRQVAIKLVPWHPGAPGAREHFRREAPVLMRLGHPAIVQIYDLSVEGEDLAIVMEYVPGRPLNTLMGDPALTPEVAVRLGIEIAAGLDYAHAAGFV